MFDEFLLVSCASCALSSSSRFFYKLLLHLGHSAHRKPSNLAAQLPSGPSLAVGAVIENNVTLAQSKIAVLVWLHVDPLGLVVSIGKRSFTILAPRPGRSSPAGENVGNDKN